MKSWLDEKKKRRDIEKNVELACVRVECLLTLGALEG